MRFANRIINTPPYFFDELDKLKKQIGNELIDFGVGDPDISPDPRIISYLQECLEKSHHHRYPPYQGLYSLREKISRWYGERFGVSVSPSEEILILIGSKEGLAHLPYCFIDPEDFIIVPTPAYPVYETAARMAGADIFYIQLKEENGFLPDLSELPENILKKTKIFYINYPANPTGACATPEFFKDIVKLASKYDFLVVNDFVYSEIYYTHPTHSILEYDPKRKFTLDIHSLSKTFNMTGWRLGFAVGNSDVIKYLLKYKTGIDSSQFGAIQETGAFCFDLIDEISEKMRNIYRERKNKVISGLNKLGYSYFEPEGTFYVWIRVPDNQSSMHFSKKILKEKKVLISPGIGFGQGGEGYARISLTLPDTKIHNALSRLEKP